MLPPTTKGDSFHLSSTWWKKAKPLALKAPDLEQALKDYEKIDVHDPKNAALALRALLKVDLARKKAIESCGKVFSGTKAALEKADAIAHAKKAHMDNLLLLIAEIQKSTKALTGITAHTRGLIDEYHATGDAHTKKTLQEKIEAKTEDRGSVYAADAGEIIVAIVRLEPTLHQFGAFWTMFTQAKEEFDNALLAYRQVSTESNKLV